MRTDTPPIIRLEDYRPSDYAIARIDLDVALHPTQTKVRARLEITPRNSGQPLVLDGDELQLVSLALDGKSLEPDQYQATPQSLTIFTTPTEAFSLLIETQINPTANTKLMGLYRSNGVYCTQCEAEGFRRITYSLDRPDVMSVYTMRLEADIDDAPVLLGNGNLQHHGPIPGTRRIEAVWHDPHPKPAYLFALVGGKLDVLKDSFITMSGREVELGIYVEPGKKERADYAMDALKRSMKWDEDVFGREYDLDVFNIVAVSDFNMGAMENKGLNVFNEKYVLASPDIATDSDYANIEAIIAHEYFHNWTGNRITCRDWFQLCLKEGLTVFRDQEFSSDQRSRAVHRISEVRTLRARQFSEDAGPLAHSVRPKEYKEINNFYTATIYEKGAELVRMIKTLLGEQGFRAGMDYYFHHFDGTAATIEDFLQSFEAATGKSLQAFSTWYEQAGTPRVVVTGSYNKEQQTYRLDFAQSTPDTPKQPFKNPVVIPIRLGLVDEQGGVMNATSDQLKHNDVFVLEQSSASIEFKGIYKRPVPSLLRGFSAPVRLDMDYSEDDLLVLLRHDKDPFNRWQAAQSLFTRLLIRACKTGQPLDTRLLNGVSDALHAFLDQEALHDPAFAALMLVLPGETDVAVEIAKDVDPDIIHATRQTMRQILGQRLQNVLLSLYRSCTTEETYKPDATQAGRRSLRNAAIDLISAGDSALGEKMANAQYHASTNMTDRLAALTVLSLLPGTTREKAFNDFGERYKNEALVLDKWFALQVSIPEIETFERIETLRQHTSFSMTNPNRVRSVLGSFSMNNPSLFHHASGMGYDLLSDAIIELDKINPQVAARLLTAFGSWKSMEMGRQACAKRALEKIAAFPDLSPDVHDIVERSLM